MGKVFLPNANLSSGAFQILILFQVALALLLWFNSPSKVIPRPGEVYEAWGNLWHNMGLGQELLNSIGTNVKALTISTGICLVLSYLTVMPFFRPIVQLLSKGRFLSMVGFTFVFTMMIGGGAELKLSLLVFGMTVFFLTSMAAVVAEIPKEQMDYARTLRMNEWKVVWEVVILGTFDKALEVMRQNAAIGWMMLTLVEGSQRSLGGVGALLLNEQKHLKMPEVFAIQITILVLGLCQDFILGLLRKFLCPYASLSLERK
ncbi:MAG: nitrate ABC transporter permease [Armatimonadetes bacterium]|nr:nitrate ABC transporter permease [Armatimonadota bacterium]